MDKTYPHVFVGMKINIVCISGELKPSIPLKHFDFLFNFFSHTYLKVAVSSFKRVIKIFRLNTSKIPH